MNMAQKFCPLNMTLGIDFSLWLWELNFFHMTLKTVCKMTQRNRTFVFKKYDSKNWTLFENMTQRIEHLENMNQRTEHCLKIVLKELNPFENTGHRIELFWKIWLAELNPSFQHDSKKLNPFSVWLKELNFFFWKMTHRIEPFYEPFFNMTQRIELLQWLKDFNCWKVDAENWTFSLNMTQGSGPQKIELFTMCLKELNFFFFEYWIKELNFFKNIESKNWTFFLNIDSKNWTFFLNIDSKNWTFSWRWRNELNLLWLKELNHIENDSKN